MPKKYSTVFYLGSAYLLRVTERKNTLANVLTLRGMWTYGVRVEEWVFWSLCLWWPASIIYCSFESVVFVVNTCRANGTLKISLARGIQCSPNFLKFLLPDQRPCTVKNMCTHAHIWLCRLYTNYRCYQIIFWTKVLQLSFQTGDNSSCSYCHIFFPIAFLE